MILDIMENIKTFLLNFLEKVEKVQHLEKVYQEKYQKILDHQIDVYSKVITINDLKQFYLAKLQGYLKDELEKGMAEKLQELPPMLEQINEAYLEMKDTLKYFKILKNVELYKKSSKFNIFLLEIRPGNLTFQRK